MREEVHPLVLLLRGLPRRFKLLEPAKHDALELDGNKVDVKEADEPPTTVIIVDWAVAPCAFISRSMHRPNTTPSESR